MTVSNSQSQITYLGTGSLSVFSFPFIADSASAIQVTYTNAAGVSTVLTPSQYTLYLNSIAAGSLWSVGGTVTFLLSGSPIATGTSLTIQRVLPYQQLTTISNQGSFNPQVIETAMDTLEMQIQQVAARGGAYRGVWATGVVYNFGDIVQDGVNGAYTNNLYTCIAGNTSSVWATDLSAGDWSLALNVQTLSGTAGYLPLSGGTISGNLGVNGRLATGTTVGSYQFAVVQAGGSQAYFGATGTNGSVVKIDSGASSQQSQVQFSTAGTSQSHIGSSGVSSGVFFAYDDVGGKFFINYASGGNLSLGATQNVTIDNSGNFSAPSLGGGAFAGLRNRIINGDMRIDQRNAGASQTVSNGSNQYTVDRWYAITTGSSATGQRVAGTGSSEYQYQFTGAVGVVAIYFNQKIESYNIYDLAGKTVTLSVKLSNSLLTSVGYGISAANAPDNYSSSTTVQTGTFTVTSTPTVYSVQIPLTALCGNGIQITFSVGSQTSGTWTISDVQI